MQNSNFSKKSLKIWQVTIGEPIPPDGERLHRAGQMCKWLSEAGHQVTFFNSTFFHQKRIQRSAETYEIKISENYRVVCLSARDYQKSISLRRFLSHKDAACSFEKWLKNNKEIPDLIIASYPVLELCEAANKFGSKHSIPVIIDCRDFWPDIFIEILPGKLRFLAKYLFMYFELKAKYTLMKATALSGHTESAMNWGIDKAKRRKNDLDFYFPFTYPTSEIVDNTSRILHSKSKKSDDLITICFIGTLSHRSGLEKFIRAINELNENQGQEVILNIAGDGPHKQHLIKLVEDYPANVNFLGWLNADEINQLMSASDFGLLPYDLPDFTLSIPNKFVEYISGGLPVISCTDGEVRKFLEKFKVGVWTENEPHSIKETLSNLKVDKNQLEQRHIISVFNDHFSSDIVHKKLESCLLRCVNH